MAILIKFYKTKGGKKVSIMKKLNQKKVTQIEALGLIDRKLNKLYIKLISSNPGYTQIAHFCLYFVLQEGSVKGDVYFEKGEKLKS